MMKHRQSLILFGLILLSLGCAPAADDAVVFHVRLDPDAFQTPVSGRLKVCLTGNPMEEPAEHLDSDVFAPEPFYYLDVENWKPGETITVDQTAKAFFIRLENLPRRRYAFQAILEPRDPARNYDEKVGILWSPVVIEKLVPGRAYDFSLVLKNIVRARPFPESDTVKEIVVPSPLLSRFFGRPMEMKAPVILPKSYGKEPGRHFPTVYVIPGFFGSYRNIQGSRIRYGMDGVGADKIYVVLDAACPLGHHTFCDSENNGPRGTALVTELIPAFEKAYRARPEAGARFLTGQSSGAWSSLWLQVTYPDTFGGAWVASPDPVDFRHFTYAGDLYAAGANVFFDAKGEVPFWIFQGYPICTLKEFWDVEDASGTVNQIQSWEAAWSSREKDGRPRSFFNRTTGAVDPETVSRWKRYDIALVLKANWPAIGDRLKGKIHLFAGDHDDYALDKAVLSLKDVLKSLGAEAEVEILPGTHVLWNAEFTARVQKGMDAAAASRR